MCEIDTNVFIGCFLDSCVFSKGGASLMISKMQNDVYHHYQLIFRGYVADNSDEDSGLKFSEQIWPMLETTITDFIIHSERKVELQFDSGKSLFTWIEEGEPFEYLIEGMDLQKNEWFPVV